MGRPEAVFFIMRPGRVFKNYLASGKRLDKKSECDRINIKEKVIRRRFP
jgi:hypothetical protein